MTSTVPSPGIDKNMDDACASVVSEISRTDGKSSLFSELLGMLAAVPIVADGAPVEWGPASVRRAAVSHEIRWSLSGREWLGPAQCFADPARHSARRKVRIAGAV
ncbi:hypothetical protein AB0E62_38895 [Streptomyces sp. NPDC038707]|uniref:hypothetical protein n=1 Tax=Streptomyces sp. NPDC038707 TaxID=3154329 RepID=UPI0033F36B2F